MVVVAVPPITTERAPEGEMARPLVEVAHLEFIVSVSAPHENCPPVQVSFCVAEVQVKRPAP